MNLLFSDEDVPRALTEALRDGGADVLTVADISLDNQKTSDEDILSAANELGRAVVTFNRKDFRKLHGLGLPHSGIIVCKRNTPFPLLTQLILALALSEEPLEGNLYSITQK